MADRDTFLSAIREAPADDGLRLIFADWLDEQGDPLGAFIRLQFELEPLHDNYEARAQELRKQERGMLEQQRTVGLGPLVELHSEGFRPVFRHGLVEAAALPLDTLLAQASDLEHWCPALRELTVFHVHERGAELAASPLLARLEHLEIADWLTRHDEYMFEASRNLSRLKTLQLWLSNRYDARICRCIAQSLELGGLQELRLLQLWGGLMAGEDAAELNQHANEAAAAVDHAAGRRLARILRPFEGLFPLAADGEEGIYTGCLPDGNSVIAGAETVHTLQVAFFDTSGNSIGVEPRYFGSLRRLGEQDLAPVIRRFLKAELNFESTRIHVKEFRTDHGLSVHHLPASIVALFRDGISPPTEPTEEEERRQATLFIHDWLERGDFVIEWDDDFHVGPDGWIHSS